VPSASAALIPWSLVVFRLAAGPVLVVMAAAWGRDAAVPSVWLLALGLVSDILDGIVARRLGVATARLRKFDSRADVVVWIGATVALHLTHPDLWPKTWPLILTLAAMEAANHAFSFLRFGKEASPHHYLSKAFGLALLGLFATLYLRGDAGLLLPAVFGLGVLSQVEAFAITARLTSWRCDVPSVLTLKG
jgi:CDP-diacylglycerol--glycerol-3-phosphate 3-phosphatidyltransferase